ncbi:uncharacterized protein LOC129730038 [Wyeomyia smithii]|uniref:uncharacterized protein LOC129730038 n=1 Tax=Wyeomyia smithii TaxID=174621 RepID=UPI0024680EE5|nr:uncharacterized protein LOC129730038 [Wyeomyia smithii]
MFAVVQFIENNKFQVLAVPVSWIKSGNLMWPKITNEKIEALRAAGDEFHGATKRIPVVISRKVRNFLAAEKIAEELTKKKKKLKPPKKPVSTKNKENNESIKYEELKKDLQQFIQDTVQTVVEKCFDDRFSKLAALLQMNVKSSNKTTLEVADEPVENHLRIDDDNQLHDWNVRLGNEDLCEKYVVYFSRIIPPNAYIGNGDSACYTIVDCLFTRDFWTRFTWTGISRGKKSKQGFREFGNILQLLVRLVCIGDPTYNAQKLESFCKNRLFRYSKSRSMSKQLRKSACRLTRKKKMPGKLPKLEAVYQIKRENSVDLKDQTDSDEEHEYASQDDPEAANVDIGT